MKALILNSGLGRRMGSMTEECPKCMTELTRGETILSRQLRLLAECGIREAIITTGPFADKLEAYCASLDCGIELSFVHNPLYDTTNYIYSMSLALSELGDEILLMHGDLVFERAALLQAAAHNGSAVVVSSTAPLPVKDFKAIVRDGRVFAIGIDRFDDGAMALQPLYCLRGRELSLWGERIAEFAARGQTSCYAEDAFNEIAGECDLMPLDVESAMCREIDTPEELASVTAELGREKERPSVYACFSSDVMHGGHIALIERAAILGDVTAAVLTDEAVASYKRFPLLSCAERMRIISSIRGVSRVVEQKELSYAANIRALKPDYVVHGDDWRVGAQRAVRDEAARELAAYGGRIVEFPYDKNESYAVIEHRNRELLSMPDIRRKRLRKAIELKGCISALEAHNGMTGLIVENTTASCCGRTRAFDAIWVSSLCDSTAKGKPDIELVDMTSRFRTIDEISEVTTKPIIFDGDTGGLAEHFAYNVRTLERMGVSAVIIEDKTGLKKNSLFGTEVAQTQESIEAFCAKLRAGKQAQRTKEFIIIARIESLILDKGEEDALARAHAYIEAGADGIMIHSRSKSPDEVFSFIAKFRARDTSSILVAVPTSYNSVADSELARRGVNVVIHANHLIRSGFPAMERAARSILEHERSLEADGLCMPIKEIISLIPGEI